MALIVHHGRGLEALAGQLAEHLFAGQPDPFLTVPVAVGSRGVERWLRHELATRLSVAANLAFPTVRQAVEGALIGLVEPARVTDGRYWAPVEVESSVESPGVPPDAVSWRPDALRFRVLGLISDRLAQDDFAAVADYLRGSLGVSSGTTERAADAVGVLSHRALAFGGEVAQVLARLAFERPAQALAWGASPGSVEPARHRWLAHLLGALQVGAPTAPAGAWDAVSRRTEVAPSAWRPMRLFGVTGASPGLRGRIDRLARLMDVHLYVPRMSTARWARTAGGSGGARAPGPNPLLEGLGASSQDLEAWVHGPAAADLRGVPEELDAPATWPGVGGAASVLARLQAWVDAEGATTATWANAPPDASLVFHSTYGPLRQVEVLRDALLRLFAEPAEGRVETRDVLIVTPDTTTFAPLVQAVFGVRGVEVRPEGARGEGAADEDDAEDAGAPTQDNAAPEPAADARDQAADQAAKRARGPRKLPEIPVAISDLGLANTNRVAEVLLSVLALLEERVTAPALFDLISLAPVKDRLGLSTEDLMDLSTLIEASGARWALDADDRAAVGQPELHANTLDFGLERLALGALMPSPGALDVVEGVRPDAPVVPLEVEGRERPRRVAALIRVTRALSALRQRVPLEGLSMSAWQALLREAMTAFVKVSDASQWLVGEVDDVIVALEEDTRAGALGDARVPVGGLRRLLKGRFEVAQQARRVFTGAVTMCGMDTMRAIPHRVVVLLGMDDKAFPRGAEPRAWDPFAEVAPGERDGRVLDRHLLLEAVMAARERLWVFWSGQDVRTGAELPAAVPVEELLDVVVRLTGKPRDDLIEAHPLQPWSAPEGGFVDAQMAEAAHALWSQSRAGGKAPAPLGLARSRADELPVEDVPPRTLDLDRLASDLVEPQRMFLRDRLGVYLSEAAEGLPDREPLDLDGLKKWGVRDRALTALIASGAARDVPQVAAAVTRRLAAEGLLPLRAGGARLVADEVSDMAAQLKVFDGLAGEVIEPPAVRLTLADGLILSGRAAGARQHGSAIMLEWLGASACGRAKDAMKAWVHGLAARAAGHEVLAARVVGRGAKPDGKGGKPGSYVWAPPFDPEACRAELEALVAVWRRARVRLLPLFEETSRALAKTDAQAFDDPEARRRALIKAARGAWPASDYGGDLEDRWVAAAFSDFDPAAELEALGDLADAGPESVLGLARRVWGPIPGAADDGVKVITGWSTEGARDE